MHFQLHSFAHARAHEAQGPLIIERGDGVFVIDDQRKRYLEAMSGLWSVAPGFSEQRLVDACPPATAEPALLSYVRAQIAPLEHRLGRTPDRASTGPHEQGVVV
ncbi:hypothetical protein [Pseudomonas typographi]|nr:hypothetical protein [Pseudomonas typographi]MBD1588542.1 hypothetical protein [Pseudomonas typographi]